MDGTLRVTYKILCESDLEKTVTIDQLLESEKVVKAIKNSFAPQMRNLDLEALAKEAILIKSLKTHYTFEIPKDDYADALTFAEEDARKNKRFKKGCDRIELVDIETVG
jgi:hypothetical protein